MRLGAWKYKRNGQVFLVYFCVTTSSMARPLRIEFPGALYHITSRGDRRENIFISDEDRSLFLEVYSRTAERFGWLCHACCLMSNHYHFVIETPLPNLSAGMAYLNGSTHGSSTENTKVTSFRCEKENGAILKLFQQK